MPIAQHGLPNGCFASVSGHPDTVVNRRVVENASKPAMHSGYHVSVQVLVKPADMTDFWIDVNLGPESLSLFYSFKDRQVW